jgi:G:T-mismatch repair DNA endonuclease (very short patch repair protein)
LLLFSKDTAKSSFGQGTRDSDKFVNRGLRKLGWRVVRVWEHELKEPKKVVAKIVRMDVNVHAQSETPLMGI